MNLLNGIIELDKKQIDFIKLYPVIKDAFFNPNVTKVKNRIQKIIENEKTKILGYYSEGDLIGSIIYTKGINIKIDYIGVIKNHRRHGVGLALISFLHEINMLDLIVETDITSVDFYKTIGFKFEEITKEYNGIKVPRFCGIYHYNNDKKSF